MKALTTIQLYSYTKKGILGSFPKFETDVFNIDGEIVQAEFHEYLEDVLIISIYFLIF